MPSEPTPRDLNQLLAERERIERSICELRGSLGSDTCRSRSATSLGKRPALASSQRIHGAAGLAKVIGRSHDYVTRKIRELGGGGLRVLWWRDEEAALRWWEALISSPLPASPPADEAEDAPIPAPTPRKRKPRKSLDDAPLDLEALRAEYRAKPH